MILYHFTSEYHLYFIEKAGVLLPSESNLDPFKSDAGPRVVWLLDTPQAVGGHGLYEDKTFVRFTVETKLAIRWAEWSVTQGMDDEWRGMLVATGGGWECAEHWWVVPGRIPRSRWVAVDILS